MSSSNTDKLLNDIWVIMTMMLLFGFVTGYISALRPISAIILTPFALLPIFFFVFIRKLNNINNRIKGLKGEWKVGIILGQMWHDGVRSVGDVVFDASRGNVDFIAVANTGVWAIETKYINGEINIVNGALAKNGKPFPRDFLKQAHAEASAVRDCLTGNNMGKVPVHPVLVFSGPYAKVRFGLQPVEGVYIVGSLGLKKLITNSKFDCGLSPNEVANIIKLFEDSEIRKT